MKAIAAIYKTLGWKWHIFAAATGILDSLGVLLGGIAAVLGVLSTFTLGILAFQKGRQDAEGPWRRLAESQERELELLRERDKT